MVTELFSSIEDHIVLIEDEDACNNIPFQSEFCRQLETVTGDVGGGGGVVVGTWQTPSS